ncbi:hypothetical protein D621_01635 [beta proteobacterium AAP51]|nr:hypothetical protein D621_01635 [beta proteobacterium AAP51]
MTEPARPAVPWQKDLQGGATAALVLLPIHGSYGLLALGPLGPGYAATGFLMGVFAAALGNLLTVLAGDRGALGVGPSAALSLLVPPLLVQLMAAPLLRPGGTPADVTTVLALLGLALAAAGVLQWLLGQLRWGAVVRYVPYPVHSGFMLGVAVLMALALLPLALGLPSGRGLRHLDLNAVRPLALLVALSSAAVALGVQRWRPGWPALLMGLMAGVALHHGLGAAGAIAQLGPVLGPVLLVWPGPNVPERLADPALWAVLPGLAAPLGQFALAVALTGGMQALMASSIVSGTTGVRNDGDRLLRTHGINSLAGGLLGLLPAAGSVASTAVVLQAGGRGTLSRAVHGTGLLLVLGLGVGLAQHLPMAAVAGVFAVVAWSLVDPWSRGIFSQLLRGRSPGAGAAGPIAVLALVAATSIGVSLVAGVLIGSLAAMLLFVRSQLRPPVRRVLRGDQQPSRTLRPPIVAEALRPLARRIVCVELDGHLFFGTADAAAQAIEQAATEARSVVLDCRRVREIDASGARVLLQLAATLQRRGCHLALAAVRPTARNALRLLDTEGLLPEARFFVDADRALEAAEERALAEADIARHAKPPLPLAQTLLGQGLDAASLARLGALLQPLALPAGRKVFERGDPGDALYLVLDGQVAIVLPGQNGSAAQRLVSFAPGAVFGEIGLLRGQPRSADAVVERDASLARLDRAALESLAAQAPAVHAQLLHALALHLGERLGALTLAVQALDDAPTDPPPRGASA